MFYAAKQRAAKFGVPFSIAIEDVVIPDKCPVLGVELGKKAGGWHAPSLDRSNPALGYAPGNVVVMSKRANTLKNDMTAGEAALLAKYMGGL